MVSTMSDIHDSGALSGPLAGVSFIIGVAGAMTLADAPYPRPGADPAEIRRYFRGNPGAARISVAGGPVHGAGFGILVGSLRLAVLRTGALPRPLAIAGLISAAAGVLSPLYFVTERAVWLIPVGRLVVSAIAGDILGLRSS